MSTKDLISKENAPSSEVKQAIRRFIDESSKNAHFKLEEREKLVAVARKWNEDEANQPQVTELLQHVSNADFEAGQEFLAAKALEMIKLGCGLNGLSQKERLDTQIRICELFITAGDIYSAERTYNELKAVKGFQGDDKQEGQFMEMRFRLVDAQFMRHTGKHADAGHVYLSYIGSPRLQEFKAQRDSIVESAILCVVLAAPSVRKSSLLANLYGLDIVRQHPLFEFVEKVLFGHMITQEESARLQQKLSVSERKISEGGLAPLEAAVFQHNIRCLLKVYEDISFSTLGQLLGVDSHNTNFFLQLETMISAGFPAQIDQVREIVTFIPSEATDKAYNQRVMRVCEMIDDLDESLAK